MNEGSSGLQEENKISPITLTKKLSSKEESFNGQYISAGFSGHGMSRAPAW